MSMSNKTAREFAKAGGRLHVNTKQMIEMIHQCFEELTTKTSAIETLNDRVAKLEKAALKRVSVMSEGVLVEEGEDLGEEASVFIAPCPHPPGSLIAEEERYFHQLPTEMADED